MPSFGSPFQHNPDPSRQPQRGADKQGQPQSEGQKLQQGFSFHTSNPYALEFLRLRESGADPTRLNRVTVMMTNWEIGYRGDSAALRVAMKEALKAFAAKPPPHEKFPGDLFGGVELPKCKRYPSR